MDHEEILKQIYEAIKRTNEILDSVTRLMAEIAVRGRPFQIPKTSIVSSTDEF